jgi:glycogen debranching enzyme
MFVISLAHLYSWTGDRTPSDGIGMWRAAFSTGPHPWRKDRDGYLEYQTRSTKATKNQGWKDSGDAIVYDDGTPVPSPIATCELQGY